MKILRLALSIGPTSPELNQFTLPVVHRHEITVCTFFPCRNPRQQGFRWRPGSGRLWPFLHELWRLLRNEHFDLVHVHSPHLGLMFLAVAIFVRPRLIRRSILHLHSSYGVYRMRNRWMLFPSFLLFARLACCSRASYESFPRLYRWTAGGRLTVVRNGANLERVDLARPTIAKRSRLADRPLQLVSVGRMRELKNHRYVIRVISQLQRQDIVFTIFGGGALIDAIREEAHRAGAADRIRVAGEVPRDELLRQLWHADGFISMSRGEGMPMAVLEAMACQCPVILSDIPPHREITVRDASVGRLVDLGDSERLTRELTRWAALSADERNAWGRRCRSHIERHFSMTQMHRQFDGLVSSLLEDRRSSSAVAPPRPSTVLHDNVA
jgi:glycosyltransferase involved in cell wall biosynthesis